MLKLNSNQHLLMPDACNTDKKEARISCCVRVTKKLSRQKECKMSGNYDEKVVIISPPSYNSVFATDGILLASFQLVEDMDKVPFSSKGFSDFQTPRSSIFQILFHAG